MVPPPPLGAMCTCIRGEHLELRGFTKGLYGTPLGWYVYMYMGGAIRTERFYQGIIWYPPLGGMCTCIRGEHLELRGFTKGLHSTPLGGMCTCIRGEHLELRGFTKGLYGTPPWVVCVHV